MNPSLASPAIRPTVLYPFVVATVVLAALALWSWFRPAPDPRLAQRAGLLHVLGETDATYAMLNKAVDERDPDILQVLFATPQMYDLRGDSRHSAILKRLGLEKTPSV